MYKSNFNLNLYKNFYDVAKYGSISKTAEKTYTSQPAISKAIKKLEEELNVQLFYRTLTGVELTDKGKELFYFVEKSFNNLLLAERNMIETENLERGKISIGMPSNVGTFFLFDKIIDFHKKYPKIEITILTGGTTNLLNYLDSHKVDFIIDTAPIFVKDKNIVDKKLKTVSYSFIVNKHTNFDYSKIKSIKDLASYPLILPICGTANRKDLDDLFYRNNVQIENVLHIHTSEMIISAVKKDLGIGYVIADLIKEEPEIESINLKEKLPSVDIHILYDKELLTTAPKRFIEEYIDHNFLL